MVVVLSFSENFEIFPASKVLDIVQGTCGNGLPKVPREPYGTYLSLSGAACSWVPYIRVSKKVALRSKIDLGQSAVFKLFGN